MGLAPLYLTIDCQPYMIYLLSFYILFFLSTAAHAVPFRFFLAGAGLTVSHFAEGHLWVKGKLMFERWLKAVERWLNSGRNAAKRGRYASIKYETFRTTYDFSGEDFQNTGAFMVVRDSVFVKSSAYKTHLARDAYHAFWRGARCRQGPFIQWSAERESDGI